LIIGYAYGIAVTGDHAYELMEQWFMIIDITDLAAPTLRGSNVPILLKHCSTANYAYIADR
jgi:hypothetical protein